MRKLYMIAMLWLVSMGVAYANGSVHHNNNTNTKGGNDQLSKVNTVIDFGDSTYSADYEEAAGAVAVDGGVCHGSVAIGTRDIAIGGAGPSRYCMLLKSAETDLATSASMVCTAPHEITKSGDAWIPNKCMAEKHRLYREALESQALARSISRGEEGMFTRIRYYLFGRK